MVLNRLQLLLPKEQGGVISGYLFNYFMDDLLRQCSSLNIGALLGNTNVSCLAYCDDLMLLSPTKLHMDKLLLTCFEYADSWKIKFNPSKSISFSLYNPSDASFEIAGNRIPSSTSGFIYLGMTIGCPSYTKEYFSKKISKVEKAFYSLRGLGCKAGLLSPRSISFIYKVYCQSIFNYGLEVLHISNRDLSLLNIRQNILLKHAINLPTKSKTTPLFQCLSVDQIPQLYFKHKLYGFKQILLNPYSCLVFNWLSNYYANSKPPEQSYFHQISVLNNYTDMDDTLTNIKETRLKIDTLFRSDDTDLVESVNNCLNIYDGGATFTSIRMLNLVLTNFNDSEDYR